MDNLPTHTINSAIRAHELERDELLDRVSGVTEQIETWREEMNRIAKVIDSLGALRIRLQERADAHGRAAQSGRDMILHGMSCVDNAGDDNED